ncbi:uncharacterized protein FIBRA_07473 [Fibroporia radiculosa]|uniref:FAD/NAD(P)-binding domain-containing protein n=1 Tax=Fibroporia radiculosa TaxID=599839 RepID=J4GEJ9_9APHY|nr:uncharacterized protein FIBRA_07473 [Fibroporia radiculosa]CCM05263.1 predicted protein [Fibroporia radiculosa]
MDPKHAAQKWLSAFATAASQGDVAALLQSVLPHGWFRDALVFTWNTRSLEGHDKIAAYLTDKLTSAQLSNFELDEEPGLCPELLFGVGVGTGFKFDLPNWRGHGYVRLLPDEATGELKAISLYVSRDSIKGHEEIGRELGIFNNHTLSWHEINASRRAAIEKDPYVIIIGAGQAGLQVAARLKQLDVPALIVEKHKAVGDQWRARYPTLSIHTIRRHHEYLYAPYPETWPEFTPREKIADWMQYYAVSQDLVVWTSSYIIPTPSYDSQSKKWTLIVDKNGEQVELHPSHIISAIGAQGPPNMPEVADKDVFKGEVIHSSSYNGGEPYAGKHAIVIGASQSSADICQDLAYRGAASVTMVERGSTTVASSKKVMEDLYEFWPSGVSTPNCDFKLFSMPMNLYRKILQPREAEFWERDKDLVDILKNNGMALTMGTDGSGYHPLVFERLGGYWWDVGLSAFIESGQVKIKQGVLIERYTEHGVVFTDGSELQADLVVFATGFGDPRVNLKETFSAEVIDRTNPVWGLDHEGEIWGSYRPTGHPGFWYAAGDFSAARALTKQLGLQLQARQLGLVSDDS